MAWKSCTPTPGSRGATQPCRGPGPAAAAEARSEVAEKLRNVFVFKAKKMSKWCSTHVFFFMFFHSILCFVSFISFEILPRPGMPPPTVTKDGRLVARASNPAVLGVFRSTA